MIIWFFIKSIIKISKSSNWFHDFALQVILPKYIFRSSKNYWGNPWLNKEEVGMPMGSKLGLVSKLGSILTKRESTYGDGVEGFVSIFWNLLSSSGKFKGDVWLFSLLHSIHKININKTNWHPHYQSWELFIIIVQLIVNF